MPRSSTDVVPFVDLVTRSGDTGAEFGSIAATTLYHTVDDFGHAVARGEDVCCFASSVLKARRNVRRRQTLASLRQRWTDGRRIGWVRQAMESAYGLYCIYRQCAAPRVPQPTLAGERSVHLGRAVQRMLRSRGVRSETHSSRQTLRGRANARFSDLWGNMRDVTCVLWLDNYYKAGSWRTP